MDQRTIGWLLLVVSCLAQAQTAAQKSFQQVQDDQFGNVLGKLNDACESQLDGAIDYRGFTDQDYSNYGFYQACERALADLLSACLGNEATRIQVQEQLAHVTCARGEAAAEVTDDGTLRLAVEPRNPMSNATFAEFYGAFVGTDSDVAAMAAEQAERDRAAQVAASPAKAQAEQDWRALASWQAQLAALPERLPAYDRIVDPEATMFTGANRQALEALARFYGAGLPRLREELAAIQARYGVAEDERAKSPYTGGKTVEDGIYAAMGYAWDPRCVTRGNCPEEPTLDGFATPQRLLAEIGRGVDRTVETLRFAEAETFAAVTSAEEYVIERGFLGKGNRERLRNALEAAKGYLAVAELAGVTGGELDQLVRDRGELQAAYDNYDVMTQERAAARRWPEPFADFQGPGRAQDLAARAAEYLATTLEDLLVVQVSGNWFVAKRNLLGDPLQYALPVQVVWASREQKAKGLGFTAEFHLHARESRDPKPEPPFVMRSSVMSLFTGAEIALANIPGKGKKLVIQP